MIDRLFVYGTLRRDVSNSKFARLLEGKATLAARGRMKGHLFDLGSYELRQPFPTGLPQLVPPWLRVVRVAPLRQRVPASAHSMSVPVPDPVSVRGRLRLGRARFRAPVQLSSPPVRLR